MDCHPSVVRCGGRPGDLLSLLPATLIEVRHGSGPVHLLLRPSVILSGVKSIGDRTQSKDLPSTGCPFPSLQIAEHTAAIMSSVPASGKLDHMADLTFREKRILEEFLGMGSGYVMAFSDRTFREFVVDSTGEDIDDPKYHLGSGSKANRLRAFWKDEPNQVVGKLISDILAYQIQLQPSAAKTELYSECMRVAERLSVGLSVQDIDAVVPNTDERSFEVLAKSVKEAIERNVPEEGIDRLHTFMVNYLRVVCEKYGITTQKDKPLHSLMGEYVKSRRKRGLIESLMAERILKSSISVLEAFNDVRNDMSLAHDNPVLSYREALLIYNHVCTSVKFITELEREPTTPSG
jgi:hypothetical protein